MNRIPKPLCEEDRLFLEKCTANLETGQVFSARGKEIGSLNPGHGRINIRLATRNVRRYHVIWWFGTGEWPTAEIDHKNRNKVDDRFDNLELSNPQLNGQNCAKRSAANADLPTGVTRNKSSCKRPFGAQIRRDGRTRSLGTFASVEEASAAYQAEWKRLHSN